MHNDCNDGMNKYIDTCVCNLVISKSETEKKNKLHIILWLLIFQFKTNWLSEKDSRF